MKVLGDGNKHTRLRAAIAAGLAALWAAQPDLSAQGEGVATATATGAERPALIVAVERGRQGEVERLLKEGAALAVQTPDGVTPLYAAAFHGRVDILRLLLKAGTKVDGRAACGRTALFTAAAEGQIKAVEVLLESGADPNARSDTNEVAQTPLHMAALEGQVETAKRLLEHGGEVNARDDKYHITPLYLAILAGHAPMAALLRERGADPSLADIYGQSPERAAAVMAARSTRRLQSAQDGQLGFDPRAVVVLPYLGLAEDRRTHRGNRVGVVFGDGSLVATAAHCLDDFAEANRQAILAKPLVCSAYYGDVFEAEIVGMDQASDVAILRVAWDGHPAVPLAHEQELAGVQEMWVAGYPPPEKEGGTVGASRLVWAERLPVLQVHGSERGDQVILGGARFVGPGWSGSPMITCESGRLAGVFGRRADVQFEKLLVLQNRMGGSVRAIQELMNANGLRMTNPPAPSKQQGNASEAFSAALNWLDTQAGRSPQEGVAGAEAFPQRRPHSALAHLFLALSSSDVFPGNPKDSSAALVVEQHYGEAARLAPGSLLIHAAYGAQLERLRRPEEALVELATAIRIDPSCSFVQALRLQILTDLKPTEAEALGRQLVHEAPENAAYWFNYAGALRKLGQNDQALDAAQTAVRLASKEQFWYRGRLADLLSKQGRLEEAEAAHRALLAHRPESPVFWLWYAEFLAGQQPQRTADLRRALERCEVLNHPPIVSGKLLDSLRAKLKAAERE